MNALRFEILAIPATGRSTYGKDAWLERVAEFGLIPMIAANMRGRRDRRKASSGALFRKGAERGPGRA